MELSIRDLIVPNDRPNASLRGNAAQPAFSGASSASVSAFNDLLRQFSTGDDGRETVPSRETTAAANRNSDQNDDGGNNDKVRQDRNAAGENARPGEELRVSNTHQPSAQAQTHDEDSTREAAGSVAENAPQETGAKSEAPETDLAANAQATFVTPRAEVKGTAIATGKTATGESSQSTDAGDPAATENTPASTGTNLAANSSAEAGDTAANVATASKGRPAQFNKFPEESFEAFAADLDGLDNGSDPRLANLVRNAMTRAGTNAETPDAGKLQTTDTKLTGVDQAHDAMVSMLRDDTVASGKSLRPMPGQGILFAQEVGNNGILDGKSGMTGAAAPATDASNGQNGNGLSTLFGGSHTANGSEAQSLTTAAAGIGVNDQVQTVPRQIVSNGIQILNGPAGLQGLSNGNVNVSNSPQASSRAQSAPPVPFEDVAVHIARAASNGSDHITIKLKPAALGQIDVKLDLSQDGRVTAVITADRSDTLEMLARDAKSLERALADAGLKADSGGLQFNLRGDGSAYGRQEQADSRQPIFAENSDAEPNDTAKLLAMTSYTNPRLANGGVDIRV